MSSDMEGGALTNQTRRAALETLMRTYFEGCNEADTEKMISCFAPNAIHYFPAGAPQGPFIGAKAIAEGWCSAVERLGSIWTVDRLIIDDERLEAVMEWTHFKPAVGGYLRGDEWYRFNEELLIEEIRAYYACPPTPGVATHEIGGFDYAARGYPLSPPTVTRVSA
jgi:hypothetical protein